MKTRYFLFVMLVMVGLTVSCSKSEIGNGEPPGEEAPVAVRISSNIKVNSVAIAKSGVDSWNQQKLYVYAFPTNTIPAESAVDANGNPRILINNAEATAPQNSTAGELILYENKEAGTLFYYPADKSTFDFYAYYVSDAFTTAAVPRPAITEGDNVKLHIKLDGSQDIMLAQADKLADTEGKEIAPSNAYGAYSARRSVRPNLVFEHQLARFVFFIVAGNDEGTRVRINKITLTSDSQADLIIAKRGGNVGIINSSAPEPFSLRPIDDRDNNKINAFHPRKTDVEHTQFLSEDKIGESIMVIPSACHKMTVMMQQMNESGVALGDEFKYEYELEPGMVAGTVGETFLPGYQYNVNVVIYGRQNVDVFVTLSEWAAGGSIMIDNDKEWDIEPKLGYKAVKENKNYYLYFYADPIVTGTEVRVWNQTDNVMIPAESGKYMFDENKGTGAEPLWGVILEKTGQGENTRSIVKTVVTSNDNL